MSEIQLHERSKDEIFNIAVQLRTDNFIKEKKIEELQNQLQQKENIIKEVKRLIEQRIDGVEDLAWVEMESEDYINEQQELLEILDKENEDIELDMLKALNTDLDDDVEMG